MDSFNEGSFERMKESIETVIKDNIKDLKIYGKDDFCEAFHKAIIKFAIKTGKPLTEDHIYMAKIIIESCVDNYLKENG